MTWWGYRLKELIKYSGYQVAPAVLEAVLLEHPEIADAAVVGAVNDDGRRSPRPTWCGSRAAR